MTSSAFILATVFIITHLVQTAGAQSLLPESCLPIVESDFAEYYEIHGKPTNLLPYRANINASVQETFTDLHFIGDQFRILVSDVRPEDVAILVRYPQKWRFYNFDKEEYFTREPDQVDYEHLFVLKGYVFYSPDGGYFRLDGERVDETLTERQADIRETGAAFEEDELTCIRNRCWEDTTNCYSDAGRLMQSAITDRYVAYMAEQLQVVGTLGTNQLYLHDLVTGLDFCFPDTLKTHRDCETSANKFNEVAVRFPLIRADSPFLERRKKFVGMEFEEALELSVRDQPRDEAGCPGPVADGV